MEGVENAWTKIPGGGSRRSDRTFASPLGVIMAGHVFSLRLGLCTMRVEACSGLTPVQCSIETGLLSHPPGSTGRVLRPVRMNVLCSPPAKATHRFCKRTWGGLVFDTSCPTAPLKFDVGD
mgnify:CR=1 FL=1